MPVCFCLCFCQPPCQRKTFDQRQYSINCKIMKLSSYGRGGGLGFIKWLSWLFFIIENTISQWNFSLDITLKKLQKPYFWQNKFLSQKKVSVTEKLFCYTYIFLLQKKRVYVTKTIFCVTKIYVRENYSSGNKFFSQKQFSSRVSVSKNVFVTEEEKILSQNCFFCHGQKLLLEKKKKVLSQKKVDRNIIY